MGLGTWILGGLLAVSLAGNAYQINHNLQTRSKRRNMGLFGPYPIKKVRLDEFDARFKPIFAGTALDAEVRYISNGDDGPLGGTNDMETWVLAAMAQDARAIFELGTASGKSTHLMAANAPGDCQVVTLTLPPDGHDAYVVEPGDRADQTANALKESAFDVFVYSGREHAHKITQIFSDSKAFDETPYREAFDLIFIDGSHAYSYVKSDTEKAFRMLAPGGVILWHDYDRRTPDVFRYLNELAAERPLVHLSKTRIAAYRDPRPRA